MWISRPINRKEPDACAKGSLRFPSPLRQGEDEMVCVIIGQQNVFPTKERDCDGTPMSDYHLDGADMSAL